MSLVVPALANAAEQETSSEVLGGWSARHQRWLQANIRQGPDHETSTPLSEAAVRLDEAQSDGGLDPVNQLVAPKADERRARALRSAFSRLENETTERSDIPVERITGMEKWEGRVIEVDDDIFSVELRPLGGGPEVIADFSKNHLAEGDDLRLGDVVYVTARTVRGKSGPTHTSTIRLRRLGRWTEAEIAEQARRAKELAAELASYVDE
ncbi:hypothetical protein BN1232_02222 [Mycobacterium lentiflavum]|uniref:Uncharacterized protein n=1 Tax=Mycobacterium lentiflavum TaxID=141349 RepID=A0A0E4CMW9_MYCLN|nr:hypothetical protein [Mycobacterium lentiflavum]CQD11819.1 hypothetical protein BN1232_02222 [Mycobacterium lentiflavum]